MKGFTIIELLLVIAIVSVFGAMSWFFGLDMLRSHQLHSQKEQALNLLQIARQKAVSNENEKSYGVRVESNKLTMFEAPFGTNPSTDYVLPITGNVTADSTSLPLDIIFSQLSGNTTAVSFSLQNSANTNFTVSVNEQGGIDWTN